MSGQVVSHSPQLMHFSWMKRGIYPSREADRSLDTGTAEPGVHAAERRVPVAPFVSCLGVGDGGEAAVVGELAGDALGVAAADALEVLLAEGGVLFADRLAREGERRVERDEAGGPDDRAEHDHVDARLAVHGDLLRVDAGELAGACSLSRSRISSGRRRY